MHPYSMTPGPLDRTPTANDTVVESPPSLRRLTGRTVAYYASVDVAGASPSIGIGAKNFEKLCSRREIR